MKDIEDLKKQCETVFRKEVVSPTDFNSLNLVIRKATGRNISVSTLKRIWGYVSYPHKPSNEILSILSVYAGYRDWHDFVNSDSVAESSDFIGADIIKSSELKRGARLQLGWKPDRVCVLEYQGKSEFKVVESQNSKLATGDFFSCSVFAKGEPLICHDVRRQGELLSEGYMAGKTDGIISLKLVE